MKCCDVRTNSLKQYHRECMENSVEKMHVDVGAERLKRVKTLSTSTSNFCHS